MIGAPTRRGPGVVDRVLPRGTTSALSIGFIAATMAFFAVLLLALGFAAGRLTGDWAGDLADVATLHVFAPEEAVESQARAALSVLRTTPGVRSVRIVEVAEQRALLAPWFGGGLALESLPMPLLIEVVSDRDRLDTADLVQRLAAEAPGAVYDDHAAWRAPLVDAARRLRIFAFGCVGLMALTLGAVLALAASAAVAENGRVIRTLRLIGARDGFVAAAFTRRFTAETASGAAIGAIIGLGLLALLPPASEQGFFLVAVGLQGAHWLVPALVPPACGAMAWVVTGLATRRNLRKWS